jgi:FtsH-binding integral membrane protein
MSQSAYFWNSLRIFSQQHNQFYFLLVFALIIAATLWRWRPQDHKPVAATLLVFIAALCGIMFSGVLAALDIKSLTKGLHEVSIFVSGMAIIRQGNRA